jgi:hypothetical protein
MYRYILRESCSQFDSLPLTSLTISHLVRVDPPSPRAALYGGRRHERRGRHQKRWRRRSRPLTTSGGGGTFLALDRCQRRCQQRQPSLASPQRGAARRDLGVHARSDHRRHARRGGGAARSRDRRSGETSSGRRSRRRDGVAARLVRRDGARAGARAARSWRKRVRRASRLREQRGDAHSSAPNGEQRGREPGGVSKSATSRGPLAIRSGVGGGRYYGLCVRRVASLHSLALTHRPSRSQHTQQYSTPPPRRYRPVEQHHARANFFRLYVRKEGTTRSVLYVPLHFTRIMLTI